MEVHGKVHEEVHGMEIYGHKSIQAFTDLRHFRGVYVAATQERGQDLLHLYFNVDQ